MKKERYLKPEIETIPYMDKDLLETIFYGSTGAGEGEYFGKQTDFDESDWEDEEGNGNGGGWDSGFGSTNPDEGNLSNTFFENELDE